MLRKSFFVLGIPLIALLACQPQQPTFELLAPSNTGVDFSNNITSDEMLNALAFEYIYNGGGVAIGDLNGDGQADLIFTGNQVSSRVYLNRGDFKFEDITEAAGLLTNRWCTGVAVVDINEDGKLDIYISVAGFQVPEEEMANLLFINKGVNEAGIPVFEEKAAAYGLNDKHYSTQAAFLDYDLDGDLDMYLLNNALEKFHRNSLRPISRNGEAASTDQLYRNNGDETFTNVSQQSGITIEGYGLGVAVSDLNFDGYPDIYAANDFLSNDLIWINNGDGTFKDQSAVYLRHQTHNGMGVDIADFNNDALPDIAVLDMLPEDNFRQKMMMPYVNPAKFEMKKKLGYQDQYMRNTLQLHRGLLADGTARFSEIGNYAGIAATDWSWSVLFADFDNDGWKDAYITNGYRKDVTNLDYINYSNNHQIFGNTKSKLEKAIKDLVNAPDVEIKNYLYKNKKNLRFENVAKNWGLGQASFSNGAAYGDLDGDGDLDLVVNNLDSPAFIYKNNTIEESIKIPPERNYLQVKFKNQLTRHKSYNAKVVLYAGGQRQYQEYAPFRGYKSTMGAELHFGLGATKTIDSLLVYWLGGQVNKYENIAVNQQFFVDYNTSNSTIKSFEPIPSKTPLFQPIPEGGIAFPQIASQKIRSPKKQGMESSPKPGIIFQHATNNYNDLNNTRTLPHQHSKSGPAMAKGDINGDGLEDFFIGGNAGQAGRFFIQQHTGAFIKSDLPFDAACQDIDCLFFDADQDGDLDLYIISGGTHQLAGHSMYQDRLYLNDGAGIFKKSIGRLPVINNSGSCVKAADFDKDGDLDLFVGGRVIPHQYPLPAESFLLENQNGVFKKQLQPNLAALGLVTDAIWTDFNQDDAIDLIVVGEWMPIKFLENKNGLLEEVQVEIFDQENQVIPNTNGWWFHINEADIDADGDMDYLVGNLGLNSKLKASNAAPLRIYAKDFDENGAIDPLIAYKQAGHSFLLPERDLLISQIPAMKRRFPNYKKYAKATLKESITATDLENVYSEESQIFASVILENIGKNRFRLEPLPVDCQFSPIFSSQFLDLNKDGYLDIITVGNFYATETTQLGYYDAAYGSVLMNKKNNQFQSISPLQTGFIAEGDVRNMLQVNWKDKGVLIITAEYGGFLKSFLMK
jgi:hypothetical protein